MFCAAVACAKISAKRYPFENFFSKVLGSTLIDKLTSLELSQRHNNADIVPKKKGTKKVMSLQTRNQLANIYILIEINLN